jgi:transposase-like protein
MKEIKEFRTSLENCPLCGSRLIKLYNKRVRGVITLKGDLNAIERVKRCSNPRCKAYHWSFFSEALQKMVLPRKLFGTDVIAEVAKLKYEEHKNHKEVQEVLKARGIHVSYGEVTYLVRAFDALIKGWQELNTGKMKKAFESKGGYVLSVDGTYSYRDKTLYIFRDAVTGTILYAETARDEEEDIKPLFEKVLDAYGKPLAVVSDMQPTLVGVVNDVLPGVKHQLCHYHFLRNAGEKLMGDEHGDLSRAVKSKAVKAKVREAIRESGVKKGRG